MTKQFRRNAVVALEKYWGYGKTIQDEPREQVKLAIRI
jgi:hypothetical protein